jgi:hypothetical protein
MAEILSQTPHLPEGSIEHGLQSSIHQQPASFIPEPPPLPLNLFRRIPVSHSLPQAFPLCSVLVIHTDPLANYTPKASTLRTCRICYDKLLPNQQAFTCSSGHWFAFFSISYYIFQCHQEQENDQGIFFVRFKLPFAFGLANASTQWCEKLPSLDLNCSYSFCLE